MQVVAHYQSQASHHLALAESDAKAGNFARSAVELERAVSYAAAAANCHWCIFLRPTRRTLNHALFMLAQKRQLSYSSARWPYRINALRRSIDRSCLVGDRPAARRTLHNAHRRAARIIHSVNRAIAADPHPSVAIPEPVEHWTINDGWIVHPTLAPPQPDQ